MCIVLHEPLIGSDVISSSVSCFHFNFLRITSMMANSPFTMYTMITTKPYIGGGIIVNNNFVVQLLAWPYQDGGQGSEYVVEDNGCGVYVENGGGLHCNHAANNDGCSMKQS